MTLNRRTLTVIVIIIAVVGAVYLAAEWQKMRKTRELLVDLAAMDLDDAYDAMLDLRERGSSLTPDLTEILERNAPTERLAHARVAMLLNDLGNKRAVPVLRHSLENKEDAGLRWASCAALASIGAQEAVPDIVALLEDGSEDIFVRIVAARSLGVLQAQEAVEPLIEILASRPPIEPEEEPEEAATEEAAAPAPTGEGAKVAAAKMWAALEKALPAPPALPTAKSEQPEEPEAEAEAEPEPPPDTTADLRPWAARALASIHPEAAQAVPALVAAADDENEPVVSVRLAATQALAYYHTAEALDGLEMAMDDPDPSVRCAAAWALGNQQAARADAVRILKAHEDDDHWDTRQAVADSLERLGEKSKRHVKTTKI